MVSNRTVLRCMNDLGYYYCYSRKKGLLSKTYRKLRFLFAIKSADINLGQNFGRMISASLSMGQVLCTKETLYIRSLLLLHNNGRLEVKDSHQFVP